MIRMFVCAAYSLPFDLPEFTWWIWVLIGVGGAIFASAVGKFSDRNRSAGLFAVIIAIASALCGAVAIYELLTS